MHMNCSTLIEINTQVRDYPKKKKHTGETGPLALKTKKGQHNT